MFTDDYKNQIDRIKPDGYIKNKVLTQIGQKESKAKPRYTKIIVRAAFAAAACFALVCSVLVINGNKITDFKKPATETNNKQDYGEIYNVVKELKSDVGIFGFGTEDKETEATGATSNGASAPSAKQEIAYSKEDGEDYSETTKQVEGVDEADIVKTDGKFIYVLSTSNQTVKVINVQGEKPKQCASIQLNLVNATDDMYLSGDRLIVIGWNDYYKTTLASIYDISNPEVPQKLINCEQSGYYNDSRLIGTKLYLITTYCVDAGNIIKNNPSSFVPSVKCGNFDSTVSAESIAIVDKCNQPTYSVVCGFDISDSSLCDTQSVLGGYSTVYCSKSNIITASMDFENTVVNRFEIDNGKINYKASGELKGSLLNQFSIDEYNGNFRFVTTVYGGVEQNNGDMVSYKMNQTNSLVILDKDLKQIGEINNIAPDERVYSVRFMGDTGYFVTFRQTDPLFSVDLSNPKQPKIIGSLKIPGFSNYLFPFGEGKLLGIGQDADVSNGRANGLKLSMFDISNPSEVSESCVTIIDADYSEAFYNHKASLVDFKKNIIAFPVFQSSSAEYMIYSFENGSFVNKAKVEFNSFSENIRGLYSGKVFYIVTDKEIFSFDMNSFEITDKLTLK